MQRKILKNLLFITVFFFFFNTTTFATVTISNGTDIVITATWEDLTWEKIRDKLISLNDSDNYAVADIAVLNKKLFLTWDQWLHLWYDNTFQFIGAGRYLQIASSFNYIENWRVRNGKRYWWTNLQHYGNNTISSQNIIYNSVETHLRLNITTDWTSTYPRLTLVNLNPNSTLEMIMSTTEPTDNQGIYFKWSWAWENTVMVGNASYIPSWWQKWFNIVEAIATDRNYSFKTLPIDVYPSSWYKYWDSEGQFWNVYKRPNGEDSVFIDGAPGEIGVGYSNYVYHPLISVDNKVTHRYDFSFDIEWEDSTNGIIWIISNWDAFQTATLTWNTLEIPTVPLLKWYSTGWLSWGYYYMTDEDFNRKTGVIRFRKNNLNEIERSYSKWDNVSEFNFSVLATLDNYWSDTWTITEISNLDEFYDEAKKWLTNNIANDNFLSISGNVINLSDYNVVVDKTASDVFSVNTSTKTITIKSDILSKWTKFESIITTWSISVSNGALIEITYIDSNSDSSVSISTSYPWQLVKFFSSISDLNSNTNPISNLVSNSSNELIYRYNSNTWSNIYIKTELSNSIWKWAMKKYELVSWINNILNMSTWWDFNYLNLQLRQIKWIWFDSWVHSLKESYSSGTLSLNQTDKDSIATITKSKIEEWSWLLQRIYDLLEEILTRIISIKSDTQGIN